MPYTAFAIGNIASGKSAACAYLASRGARHIDLDSMAKSLYVPGSQLVHSIANEFGWDILDEFGAIRSAVLASRAFDTPESIASLNAIVHPVLIDHLSNQLLPIQCCSTVAPEYPLTVVEVSAAASFTDAFGLADEVLAVHTPLDIRRTRALGRGMSLDDFEARASVQPADDQLIAMADHVIDNTAGDDSLFVCLDSWIKARGITGLEGVGAHA